VDEAVFDEIVGMAPRSDIEAGDPVRLARFGSSSGSIASLEHDLPSGYRAISVPIDAITAAGGFVLPGSHVDVMHVHSPGVGPSVTRIIAGNTRVIALDHRQSVDEEQATAVARTATLEVTIDQARSISAAERDGKIVLALRSIADRNELTREYEDRETVPVRMIAGGTMTIRMID
jgi:pilus assembly protein CpaB